MIKLSREILFVGIAVLVLGQGLQFFTRFMGLSLPITLSFQLVQGLFYGFELMLLNSILIQIQKDKSFTVWLVAQFVTHMASSIMLTLVLTYSRELFIEHNTLINVIPRVLILILQLVLAVKFFLLNQKLAIWFKIYTAALLLQIAGLSIGVKFFESYGDAIQVFYNVTWGLSLLVSVSLILLFFQAIQEIDQAAAPKLSDDILDFS